MDLSSHKWRRTEDIFRMVRGRILVVYRQQRPRESKESSSPSCDYHRLVERVAIINAKTIPSLLSSTDEKNGEEGNNDTNHLIVRTLWQTPTDYCDRAAMTSTSSVYSELVPSSTGPVCVFCLPELTYVSSTQVRSTADASLLQEHITPSVLSYIQAHGLYMFSNATTAVARDNISSP